MLPPGLGMPPVGGAIADGAGMGRLPHVTWLRAFEAAARHSSFSAAALELNLTPAAVSQQIRLLEKHLGIPLFKRLSRGVELTDLGQAYAQPIRKSFQDMQAATDGLFDRPRRAVLRVRASISYAALVLAPRLPAFRTAHPDIEIRLSTAVWADRMDDAAIDLDIRYGTGDWPERDCHPLGAEEAMVVCHPDYAASFGEAVSIRDLAAGDVVQVVGSEVEWDRLSERFDLDLPKPRPWIKADSSLIALQTIAAGRGAAIINRSFAQHYLEIGRLISPFDYRLTTVGAFFLIARPDANPRPEVSLFRTWLATEVHAG